MFSWKQQWLVMWRFIFADQAKTLFPVHNLRTCHVILPDWPIHWPYQTVSGSCEIPVVVHTQHLLHPSHCYWYYIRKRLYAWRCLSVMDFLFGKFTKDKFLHRSFSRRLLRGTSLKVCFWNHSSWKLVPSK